MMRGYPIDLTRDEDGSFLATCPVLPEVTTFGDDLESALIHSIAAVEEAIAGRIADWQELPAPREVQESDQGGFAPLPLQTLIKAELFRLLRSKGMTRADLVERLGGHREQIDDLLRLDRPSSLDQIEAALRTADAEIDVNVRPLAKAS